MELNPYFYLIGAHFVPIHFMITCEYFIYILNHAIYIYICTTRLSTHTHSLYYLSLCTFVIFTSKTQAVSNGLCCEIVMKDYEPGRAFYKVQIRWNCPVQKISFVQFQFHFIPFHPMSIPIQLVILLMEKIRHQLICRMSHVYTCFVIFHR